MQEREIEEIEDASDLTVDRNGDHDDDNDNDYNLCDAFMLFVD